MFIVRFSAGLRSSGVKKSDAFDRPDSTDNLYFMLGRAKLSFFFGGLAAFATIGCTSFDPRDYFIDDAPRRIRLPAIPISVDSPKPRGLVLVTTDTLRADYLSCYGHARVVTPSFDRLASGGVLFRNAVAPSTTTSPSHASLMTGLYPQDHNVFSNFEAVGSDPRTLAETLQGRGFRTFALVNMRHLNSEISNLGQGFDVYEPSGFMRRAGPSIDKFLSWLDGIGDERFFAWLHLADVHTPYRPPPPYDRFYYDDDERDPEKRSLEQVWPLLPDHMSDHPFFRAWLDGITDVRWVLAQYQGAVTYVDDEIGRLLDALEDRDLLHRTGFVFTSDHGESLGEHEMFFVHTGLYEATVRVPLLAYFPGATRSGVEVRDMVELIDVFPTITQYFDIPPPRAIRGRSLWPLIRGEIQPARVAMIEHAGRNLVALRTDEYKYIKHLRTNHLQPAYPFVAGKEELYDLKRDPLEQEDIASDHPEVMAAFRRTLTRYRDGAKRHRPGTAHVTAETESILRALGYVR